MNVHEAWSSVGFWIYIIWVFGIAAWSVLFWIFLCIVFFFCCSYNYKIVTIDFYLLYICKGLATNTTTNNNPHDNTTKGQ